MNSVDSPRIAWLLPITWFYWQPLLSEFTKLFPKTTIFTSWFSGYARGFEDSLTIEMVGSSEFKIIGNQKLSNRYNSGFTYISPAVVLHLLRFKPDLILANSFGIWTILALLLKPLVRWKVIIAYEGSSPNVDYRYSKLRLAVRRSMVWLADGYITNSQAGKAYLTEVLYADADRVLANPYEVPSAKSLLEPYETAQATAPLVPQQVPSGANEISVQGSVPLETAVSPSLTAEDVPLDKPIFLFVGRIIPRKGLSVLLEACALLRQRSDRPFSLVIVGDGPQRSELEELSQTHQLTDCVQWVGQVSYDRVNDYLRQADVFVLPTFEDTWGVAVLEGMLFGKAILCSQGAGSAELIVDGQNGYVFDPHQPQQLAELMERLLDQPEMIAQMGEHSKQIMATYTPDRAAQGVASLVNRLLK